MGDAKKLAKMSTIQMGIRVPLLLHEKLQERAQQENVSKTAVVLSALARYLDSLEDAPLSVRIAELERRVASLEAERVVSSQKDKG